MDRLLAAGTDPGARRIGLTDAPAVPGIEGWTAIQERHGVSAAIETIRSLQATGVVRQGDATRLAKRVMSMPYGAIVSLPAQADQTDPAMAEMRLFVHAMLDGLRCDPGPHP